MLTLINLGPRQIFQKFDVFIRPVSNLSFGSADVRIVEVSPRDGLQNEKIFVPTNVKVQFINLLSETGLKTIEATSFVSSKWIPQMSDSTEVFRNILKREGVSYPVLVPNMKGFESAIDVGVQEVAVFGAASETFSQKNTNCSTANCIERFTHVIEAAQKLNVRVRGYVSTVVGCPYEGKIKPLAVARVAEALLKLGCYEISLGDTIGVGTPESFSQMLEEVLKVDNANKFAVHCHDTYGQALVNILTALNFEIRVVDSSVSGLGGCPYAHGASGNAATEDVLYMLDGLGVSTGVNLSKLVDAGRFICKHLGRLSESKVNRAMQSIKK